MVYLDDTNTVRSALLRGSGVAMAAGYDSGTVQHSVSFAGQTSVYGNRRQGVVNHLKVVIKYK